MKKTVEKKLTPTKKSSSARHFAHVGRAMHHHKAHGHMPKFFYHKGSLLPTLTWRISFVALIVFFLGYFIVNHLPSETSPSTEQIVTPASFKFAFQGTPEDWGMDSDLLKSHGAASNEFDFLFQEGDSTNKPFYPSTSTGKVNQVSDNSVESTTATSSATDIGGSSTSSSNEVEIIQADPCTTPWGEKIQHGDFVLAYQQRSDVNDLCNVQKRYCTNGTLNGSYTQQSCKQNVKYDYTKVVPVAENDPEKVDPFIQPNAPRYSGANFDNNGKISSSQKATDNWSDSGKSAVVSTGPYVTGLETVDGGCTTPWGEKIPVGQFVKAYKTPVGMIDMPCEVEIRLCTKSGLKGSLKYSTCEAKNMTYSDYLLDEGENTNTPNISDLTTTLMTDEQKKASSSPGFWKWLDDLFR